jgi:valyl-tRNA synthetase
LDIKNSQKYIAKEENMLNILMKKNRFKFLEDFATYKFIMCTKEFNKLNINKAEKLCSDSLNLYYELNTADTNKYLSEIKNVFKMLIKISSHIDIAKKEKYKKELKKIKQKIKEVRKDTSGRNFNLIVGYLDEIVKKLDANSKNNKAEQK